VLTLTLFLYVVSVLWAHCCIDWYLGTSFSN